MTTQGFGIVKARSQGEPGLANFRRVYVWELPVRIFHWVNALSITMLCATGYLIGAPVRMFFAVEAYQQYWFGAVRFTHFAFAFLFTFNLLFRLYWGFVGNKYSRLINFLPLKKAQRQEIIEVLKADIMQTKLHGPLSTGHNALAALTYIGLFGISAAQILTGFSLYSGMSLAFLPKLFLWVSPLVGGEFAVRFAHHLLMWFFILFVIVHVYLTFYHDYIEGRGVISSIVGGWKFERRRDDH